MKAQVNQDYTVVFTVAEGDAFIPGLDPGDFTVTVADPTGAAETAPAVSAAGVGGGLYQFTVPGAFLTARGTYVASILVDDGGATQQAQTHFIDVVDDTLGVKTSVTWVAASNQIVVNAWLEDAQSQPIAAVEDCSVLLVDSSGTTLEGPEVVAAPLLNGVFEVVLTAPALAVGEHAAMLYVSIARLLGATYTSITGLTFSRTS